jgi:hypothetical protein
MPTFGRRCSSFFFSFLLVFPLHNFFGSFFLFGLCLAVAPPHCAYSSATLSINVFSLTIYRSCALVMKGDVLGNHYVMMQLRRIIWSRCTVSNIYIKLPCYKPLFSLSLSLSFTTTNGESTCVRYIYRADAQYSQGKQPGCSYI